MRLCSWINYFIYNNSTTSFRTFLVLLLIISRVVVTSLPATSFTGYRHQRSISLSALNICSRIPGLTTTQATLCRLRPDLMVAISKGAQLGQLECRKKFKWQRWNCSATIDTALSVGLKSHPNKYFSNPGSREVSFLYSITSAGVVYTVSQWCSRGMLRHCGCDKRHPKSMTKKAQKWDNTDGGKWKWGGCSVDVRYGIKIARIFLDSKETRSLTKDQYAMVNIHNNRAGRKAVLHKVRLQCKCHGVSGSCSLRTCWRTLPPFTLVGDHLLERYRAAKRVIVSSKTSVTLPATANSRHQRIPSKHFRLATTNEKGKPRPKDLVFSERSPDYCQTDNEKGILGTRGRFCRKSSSRDDEDSCHFLCCGRGYDTHLIRKTWQCNCKFHWCCSVQCNQCTKVVQEFTCK